MRRKFWQGRVSVYSTVCSGLSALYGSWKTICTRACSLRSPPARSRPTFASPNVIVPDVGRSEPVISLASVLLPLPLAPTRPTAVPGASVNETSSHRGDRAAVAAPGRPLTRR